MGLKLQMQEPDLLFAAHAAGHGRLVADHDDQVAGPVQALHGSGGGGEEFDLLEIADVAAVTDQRAVAVEECRLFHLPGSQSSLIAPSTSSTLTAVMQR